MEKNNQVARKDFEQISEMETVEDRERNNHVESYEEASVAGTSNEEKRNNGSVMSSQQQENGADSFGEVSTEDEFKKACEVMQKEFLNKIITATKDCIARRKHKGEDVDHSADMKSINISAQMLLISDDTKQEEQPSTVAAATPTFPKLPLMAVDNCDQGCEHVEKNEEEMIARKELLRLGLKPVTDINRVTFRREGLWFEINDPEVFLHTRSQTYIVFGEAKLDEISEKLQLQKALDISRRYPDPPLSAYVSDTDSADDTEFIDCENLDWEKIEMVMEQCEVSFCKAVKALQKHDCDIVDAIMELTMGIIQKAEEKDRKNIAEEKSP